MNPAQAWSKLLTLVRHVGPNLPTREDSWVSSASKAVLCTDLIYRNFFLEEPSKYIQAKYPNSSYTINPYIRGLLESHPSVSGQFKTTRSEMTETLEVVELSATGIGVACFIARKDNLGTPISIWYSPGFDFAKALAPLWEEHGGQLALAEIKEDWAPLVFSKIPETTPLLGQAANRLSEIQARHRQYIQDGVNRTYLFLGPPGTGKWVFARELAREGARLLRIDAQGLSEYGLTKLDLVLQSLQPTYLVIDDLDRCANLESSAPTLLSILSDLKGKFPQLTVIITANSSKNLPDALLRPGRVDEIIDFPLPDAEDRREILRGYCQSFSIPWSDEFDAVVEASEGLTGAFLKETALQLRYQTVPQVCRLVTRMKELRGESPTAPLKVKPLTFDQSRGRLVNGPQAPDSPKKIAHIP